MFIGPLREILAQKLAFRLCGVRITNFFYKKKMYFLIVFVLRFIISWEFQQKVFKSIKEITDVKFRLKY